MFKKWKCIDWVCFSYMLVLLPNFVLILDQDVNRNNTLMLFLSWYYVEITIPYFIILISIVKNLTFIIFTVSTYFIVLSWKKKTKNNTKWCWKIQKLKGQIWGSNAWISNIVIILPVETLSKHKKGTPVKLYTDISDYV